MLGELNAARAQADRKRRIVKEGIRRGAGEESALRRGLIGTQQDDMGIELLGHLLQELWAGGAGNEYRHVLIPLGFVHSRCTQGVTDSLFAGSAFLLEPLLIGTAELA